MATFVHACVLLFLLSLFPSIHSQTLTVSTQPALAIGGEPFVTQPVVQIIDGSGNLAGSYSGYVYATLQASPSGFEELYYLGSTTNLDNIVPVVNGIASFSELTLNEAGSGYTLRFIGLDSTLNAFAYVDSSAFINTIGDAYKIAIATYPGSASGGAAFKTQPKVELQVRSAAHAAPRRLAATRNAAPCSTHPISHISQQTRINIARGERVHSA